MVGDKFREFAHLVSRAVGSPTAFFLAAATIVVWGATGPIFHFSDTWQLVINTSTTIVTFLMVFLIQTTQNRDAHAMHLKLDELIHVTAKARNRLVALEGLSDAELDRLETEFQRVRGRPSSSSSSSSVESSADAAQSTNDGPVE